LTKPPDAKLRTFSFPQDFPAVKALWSQAGPGIHLRRSDQVEEIAKKIQRDPDLFLVAELNGDIVGSVMGGFDGRRGMMYHLAVAQGYRKQGIGDALVELLEQRLREKGCLRYYLLVTRENVEAIEFYQHRGFHHLDLDVYGKDLE
jgi:ribosomal protein S18 acetylase RimI-like enzyme